VFDGVFAIVEVIAIWLLIGSMVIMHFVIEFV
jgi:hypothetical protein